MISFLISSYFPHIFPYFLHPVDGAANFRFTSRVQDPEVKHRLDLEIFRSLVDGGRGAYPQI